MKLPALPDLTRKAKLLGLAVALLVLQGCSSIKLGYNNAPSLAYWWLDGYMDIEDSQSQPIRDALERLHQWHRANELPKIEALLQRMQVVVVSDITPAQVCSIFADTRLRMRTASGQAVVSMAAIATTITPSQRQHIARKFEKNNAAWKEEWTEGTADELRAKRIKAGVESAEEIYGSLDEKQIALWRELDATSSYDEELSFKERVRRQKDFLQTLARLNSPSATEKPDQAQVVAQLQDYLARNANSPDLVFRAYSEKMVTESCNAFAVVHNSTTPKQRERALKRITAYASDARELMGVKESK
jgi:Family of unknown function (DUF6279)